MNGIIYFNVNNLILFTQEPMEDFPIVYFDLELGIVVCLIPV